MGAASYGSPADLPYEHPTATVSWHAMARGLLRGASLPFTGLDETAAKGRHAWGVAREKLASGDYDLLILDELTYAITYGWVSAKKGIEY